MRLPTTFARYGKSLAQQTVRRVSDEYKSGAVTPEYPRIEPGRDIIQLELNEVPNLILDRYVEVRPYSTLASILGKSRRYTTTMTHEGMLEPWTGWPTFHRGVDNTQHRLFALGQPTDDIDQRHPPVWSLLHKGGVRVGVFGSLWARLPLEVMREYAFFVPDYFHHEFDVHPASLTAFQTFNLRMTRASRHVVDRNIPVGDALRFLVGIPGSGIRPGTLLRIGRQLLMELGQPHLKLRRRSLQSRLMADIFIRLLEKKRPQFATFFYNPVATSLHRFWGAAFSDDWDRSPFSKEYQLLFQDEVWIAMDEFDEMLSRIVEIAGRRNAIITIASAFGQQPIPAFHASSFVTLIDLRQFMHALGFPPSDWKTFPSMTPHFSVAVAPENALRLAAGLAGLRIAGHQMVENSDIRWPLCFRQVSPGFFSIYFSIDAYDGPHSVEFADRTLTFSEAGIGIESHEHDIDYTAYHTTDGSLTIYDPLQSVTADVVPRLEVVDYVPSLLRHFGQPVPETLAGRADLFSGS